MTFTTDGSQDDLYDEVDEYSADDVPTRPIKTAAPAEQSQEGVAERPLELDPPAEQPDGTPARPRSETLLNDSQRAAFLSEWDTVQTGFVTDPRRAAEAAGRLVRILADTIAERVGEIADSVGHPEADDADDVDGSSATSAANTADTKLSEPEEEKWREHLLRCREAFHELIDS
ncbi:hypothetical protein GCM10009839_89140 [Catenulispora yoronensis]|uniref:Uncharacterized protein n=1 Tax=Catenulispora yoronensis TaxID=450799 RepID=A0ABP5H8C3_9ACTN